MRFEFIMIKQLLFKGFSASLLFWVCYACSDATSKTKTIADTAALHTNNILPAEVKNTIDSNQKVIYLTFDDGPQHGTMAVARLCQQLHIKASFFMVGSHAEQKSDGFKIVDSIKRAYPLLLLANHSYSHAYSKYRYFYQHPQTAFDDFIKNQQLLAVPYKIIRLPGNSAWVTQNRLKASDLVKPVCNLLNNAGYNVTGWDVDWSVNYKTASPVQSADKMRVIIDSAFAKDKVFTKNHLVLLSHDRMFRSPQYLDSLARFIQLLQKNKDYRFETIDHYPQLKPL